jgi:hypothetical protein
MRGTESQRRCLAGLERETGFEPATACLEGRSSTTELLPRDSKFSRISDPDRCSLRNGVR